MRRLQAELVNIHSGDMPELGSDRISREHTFLKDSAWPGHALLNAGVTEHLGFELGSNYDDSGDCEILSIDGVPVLYGWWHMAEGVWPSNSTLLAFYKALYLEEMDRERTRLELLGKI